MVPVFITINLELVYSEPCNFKAGLIHKLPSYIYLFIYSQIRWVVESANARIKQWRYLGKILPSNQIPHIGDFVRIVCAISNRHVPFVYHYI